MASVQSLASPATTPKQSEARPQSASQQPATVVSGAPSTSQQPPASVTRVSQQPPTATPRVSQQVPTFAAGASQQAAASPLQLSPPPYTPLLGIKLPDNTDTYVQHPVQWYPDGDIFLQIGETRFKVFSGLLKAFSNWFRRAIHRIDCLDLSCSHVDPTGTPLPVVFVKVANVGGMPLLYIDAAQTPAVPAVADFALLLEFLYRGRRFICNPLAFNELVSLYRAATYYCFPDIIALVKEHIEGIFPSDFLSLDQGPTTYSPEAAFIIGTKFRIDGIRKRAFYDIVRSPTVKWHPITPSPSKLHFSIPIFGSPGTHYHASKPKVTTFTLDVEPASATTVYRICALREHLGSAWDKIQIELQSLTCPVGGCLSKNLHTLSNRAVVVKSEHPYDPLHGLRILAADENTTRALCNRAQDCLKSFLEKKEAFIVQALEKEWIILN